jgi:hypothetical protein
MRAILPLGVGVALLGLAAGAFGGCVAGSSLDSGDGGVEAGSDAASSDGASSADGATNDAASSDGGATDSGLACGQLGGNYESAKACSTAADCTTVARGCYCGAQPVIGIAKSSAAVAQACESKAANQCALGCASFPGQVAEDGANNGDGGTIIVKCDLSKCHTVLQ